MKKNLLLIAGLIFTITGTFAQTTTETFQYGNVTRQYKLHLPPQHGGGNDLPLVIGLHGLGDNANNFMLATGFNAIADTAGFIGVYPYGLVDQFLGGASWNNGINPLNSTDDVGFLSALIDNMVANYDVEVKRVYVTGFSMGGFMTQRLACELDHKVAAIASIAGVLSSSTITSCSPSRAMPIMHCHGTADSTISWDGTSVPFITSVDATIDHWVSHNNCTGIPTVDTINTNTNDPYEVVKIHRPSCDDNSEVLLYKVIGANHTWLGPTNDIYYTEKIWEFFLQHEHPTAVASVGENNWENSVSIFPMPSKDILNVSGLPSNGNWQLELMDLQGRIVKSQSFNSNQTQLDVAQEIAGLYLLRLWNEGYETVKKIQIVR